MCHVNRHRLRIRLEAGFMVIRYFGASFATIASTMTTVVGHELTDHRVPFNLTATTPLPK